MVEYKDEVVISGIGGRFPECDNVDELRELLFNKINAVTIDSRRWDPNDQFKLDGTGKMKTVDTFDATFFSAHPKLAEAMDPITKIFIEKSIEAIIDAGLSPLDLSGTNTAVFSGSYISETEMFTLDSSKTAAFSMLGRSRTMQANRVSYILNLTGPSFTMDGGWLCGANGLEKAKNLIERGIVSSAIVGTTNLMLRSEIQLQYQGLNRLNKGIQTKSFSSDADGYNRSEACVVMLLQRSSEAKRSYGTILSVKSMLYGDFHGHITEHNGTNLKSLLLDCYKDANVDPSTVEYIEAYGSGIKIEDSMELNVMEEVFCSDRRDAPLKVGSIKSNIGHCEVASLFVSIVKAIIALEYGYIPPNINYTKPNENLSAIKSGKIKIVTEKTPIVSNIIGITAFGILNGFSHIIIKQNNKKIKDNIDDNKVIPQLILTSGRTEQNVQDTMNKILSHGNNAEFIAMTNAVFTKNINAHFYRSYTIIPSSSDSKNIISNVSLKKRPVWFIFSGMGSQWQGMGEKLMNIPIFMDAINKCDAVLKPRGIDIKHILSSQNPVLFDNILNSFVGIAAVQIGLVDILRALDIVPDGILGHSVGELGCAYADGCFTAEEMILSAYSRGRASLETDLIAGMMAAIGLGYNQIKDRLPHDVEVACRNSDSSCTISGPVESINTFVAQLKSEGIFAKSVNVGGIAFHSRYIKPASPVLLKYLKEVIKEPKARSSKWISSSLMESEWNSELGKYSSPEYHTNNLLNSVLFEDALKHIPNDAITIEIAPHGLLQAIIRGALPDTVSNIALTKRVYGDTVKFLLTAIGQLYMAGLNPNILELYPKINYPVSRGTPSIHSLPFWDHNEIWTPLVAMGSKAIRGLFGEKTTTLILNDDKYLTEYRILGQHVFPLSHILVNVWEMFVQMKSKTFSKDAIQFDNLQFKNNFIDHSTDKIESYVMIQRGSGLFEFSLNDQLILSGQISFLHELNVKAEVPTTDADKASDSLHGSASKDEIYNIFENSRYNLGDNFKNIASFKIYGNEVRGYVEWKNDWVYFLDGLLKFPVLENISTCSLHAPVSVRQIIIHPEVFEEQMEKVYVNYNTIAKEITCNGVKICDVKTSPVTFTKHNKLAVNLEEQKFIRFDYPNCNNVNDFIYDLMNIIQNDNNLNIQTANGKCILCIPDRLLQSLDGFTRARHENIPIKTIIEIIGEQLSSNSIITRLEDVNDLQEYDESGSYITAADYNDLKNTTKALANKKYGYVIVCGIKNPQAIKGWKIIVHQKFDDNTYLTLMKKEIELYGNGVFIKPAIDDYDNTVWKTLEKHESSKEKIYIISDSEPLGGIVNHVKEMLIKYKSPKLRFLFILDSNAPGYESNKSFYMNQLSKDLMVNIYKNGGWGYYKRVFVENIKDNKTPQNLVLKKVSSKSDKFTLKYLGLNFKDLIVEEKTENELGLFEYSGLVDANKMRMGIASCNEMSSELKFDEILSWPVPTKWSLEEATTVPLNYALSYYVLNILCNLNHENTVLITSGLHPMGQAIISIALHKKCKTYVVVQYDQQVDQLINIFPELPRSRIIVNTNDKFDIDLKMITEANGVDFILNFLDGKAFQAAFRAIAKHGKFFHFSKADMSNRGRLGTRIFLQNTSFTIICPTMLLNETDQNKTTVQKAFADGLNKGVIKPIPRNVLKTPLNSNIIFDAMRNASKSNTSEKVILSLNDDFGNANKSSLENFKCDTYQCNPNYIYIIFGNASDWLDLAEWLADRGAQKIVITIKRCLISSINSRRFDKLISRNVSVQIESNVYLNNRVDSLSWLNRLSAFNVIGSVFIINQNDSKKIENLGHAFKETSNKTIATSFLNISSNGEHVCSQLKSVGFNALNVQWGGKSSQSNNIFKMLPALDTLIQKSNATESSSFVCYEKDIKKVKWSQQMNNFIAHCFPESVEELHQLKDKITTEARFVEVMTQSPKFQNIQSVTPVFFVPGFKQEFLKPLYKKLFFPAFEAQLPEVVGSIDDVAKDLVDNIKTITDKHYISLIGESWGGIVALKMAQILEDQDILVTVSLIEGEPESLIEWAGCFLSNNNFIDKLNTKYNLKSTELSKYVRETSNKQLEFKYKTQEALNWVQSCLKALIGSKPLSNKLITKVVLIKYKRTLEFYKSFLNDVKSI
ncbi:Hypothetical protein CINCED_3A006213 [Cinara cedri]|uniref:Ketosynthase family 3 (KS3) domain-containing protein n=1 Tax=Cinara cedri TaxID=506608 RepID=A0A5E4MCL8_9HEMI|nr:Hypothetical protein CINCED_3A006213 [Cinara cedri]